MSALRLALVVGVVAALPSAALADLTLAVDANAVAPSQTDSTGFGLGVSAGMDLLGFGPVGLGPHVRLGTASSEDDRILHGSIGARLTVDFVVALSASVRVGVGDLSREGLIEASESTSGSGFLLEGDITAEFPLFGPLTIGARYGHSRIFLSDEDYSWPSYGLQLGLRI